MSQSRKIIGKQPDEPENSTPPFSNETKKQVKRSFQQKCLILFPWLKFDNKTQPTEIIVSQSFRQLRMSKMITTNRLFVLVLVICSKIKFKIYFHHLSIF